MQNHNGDDNECDVTDAGACADLSDEMAITDTDFLEQTQARLAREGWELRGDSTERSISEALDDPVNEILFVRIPGKKKEFYYFERLKGSELTDGLRNDQENFLEFSLNELARELWEYRNVCNAASFDEALEEPVQEILIVRSPQRREKFYVFHRID